MAVLKCGRFRENFTHNTPALEIFVDHEFIGYLQLRKGEENYRITESITGLDHTIAAPSSNFVWIIKRLEIPYEERMKAFMLATLADCAMNKELRETHGDIRIDKSQLEGIDSTFSQFLKDSIECFKNVKCYKK